MLVRDTPAALCLPNKQGHTPLDLISDPRLLLMCVRHDPIKIKTDAILACQICRETFGIKLRKVGPV